jgi:uncharacterized protein YndB with AHSA1/START domain
VKITVEDEIRIAAPVDAVWALTQDWPRRHEWDPFVRDAVVESEDPLVLRLTLERGVRAIGRATEYERPHRVRMVLSDLQGGGPVKAGEGAWDYEDGGDGTTLLRQRLTLELGGLMGRAAAPMVKSGLEQATRTGLARTRERLESPQS